MHNNKPTRPASIMLKNLPIMLSGISQTIMPKYQPIMLKIDEILMENL